jgi:hypothetical protein
MPLNIGEIGVRVAVRDPNEKPAVPAAAGCGGTTLGPAQQDQIVAECVRLVLQVLRMNEVR